MTKKMFWTFGDTNVDQCLKFGGARVLFFSIILSYNPLLSLYSQAVYVISRRYSFSILFHHILSTEVAQSSQPVVFRWSFQEGFSITVHFC